MKKGEIKIVMDLRDLECMTDHDMHDSFFRQLNKFMQGWGYTTTSLKASENGLVETVLFNIVEDREKEEL